LGASDLPCPGLLARGHAARNAAGPPVLPRCWDDQDHGLRRDHDDVSVSDYDHVGDRDHDYDHGFVG
jgi:hypothetical protein